MSPTPTFSGVDLSEFGSRGRTPEALWEVPDNLMKPHEPNTSAGDKGLQGLAKSLFSGAARFLGKAKSWLKDEPKVTEKGKTNPSEEKNAPSEKANPTEEKPTSGKPTVEEPVEGKGVKAPQESMKETLSKVESEGGAKGVGATEKIADAAKGTEAVAAEAGTAGKIAAEAGTAGKIAAEAGTAAKLGGVALKGAGHVLVGAQVVSMGMEGYDLAKHPEKIGKAADELSTEGVKDRALFGLTNPVTSLAAAGQRGAETIEAFWGASRTEAANRMLEEKLHRTHPEASRPFAAVTQSFSSSPDGHAASHEDTLEGPSSEARRSSIAHVHQQSKEAVGSR